MGLVAATLALASAAHAENRAASNLSLYTDDDHTDVITSVTRASIDAWTGGTVEASYLIDIISSASIDVVSAATPRFDENRQALGLGARHDFGGAVASVNYGYSHEPDYDGHGAGLGLDLELAERNATFGVSYAIELSKIGRSQDPNFSKSLTTHVVDIKGSQILTTWLVADLGYSLAAQDGYNAKPYRYARVKSLAPLDPQGIACRICVDETHPELRLRNAVFGGLKAHLFAETAAEARYRAYFDNWGMHGHTVELLGHIGLNRNFGARLRYRFYWQNEANFWQFEYDTPQKYMTRDRELSPLSAHLVGLKLFARAEDVLGMSSVQVTAKFDGFKYDYRDFPLLDGRLGFVIESGLEVVF